jgi:DNA-binding FadR family transcriptional regulator
MERRRLHREAMLVYLRDIVSGALVAGDALPREVTVAERFGISRGVAREALRALEERGLATVRHGSRTIVSAREEWDLFDPDVIAASLEGAAAVPLLTEYLECRRVIEIAAAGLAAERATADTVISMETALAAMRAASELRRAPARETAFHEADVAFHAALVAGTGNLALLALVRRVDAALLAARYPLARPANRRTRAIPEHEAIVAAVATRNAAGARQAMQAHLDTVEGYLREHAAKLARAAA